MPFAELHIEQTSRDSFLAIVEVNFPACKRYQQHYGSMREALDGAWAFYAAVVQPTDRVVCTELREVEIVDARHALIAEAEAKGVEIDRRWGVERLRQVLAEHEGMVQMERGPDWTPPAPVSKTAAQKMRDSADRSAEATDPGLVERRMLLEARRF